MSVTAARQDKAKEVAFFDGHAAAEAYDVFTPETNRRLIDAFARLSGLPAGARVADLGCGSGVFTALLADRGYRAEGIDLSPKLIDIARDKFPSLPFHIGDVEQLPFETSSLDGILLNGLVHHLPDPSRCAAEMHRVLRPGGRFVGLDPNRMNPFMYLYRDRSSPLYSSVGVTSNERPVLAHEIATVFRNAGFRVETDTISNLRYRYLASAKVRWLLPAYNALDAVLFAPGFMQRFRAFVLTSGEKP